MEEIVEASTVHLNGLIQLQQALNDLQEIADAIESWSETTDESGMERLKPADASDSDRPEFVEALARLFDHSFSSENKSIVSPESRTGAARLSSSHRFEVVRRLAEGGLGTVSVAVDHELNRQVAIKTLHDRKADDPSWRERFLIEGEITGGLEHPGIVPVYSRGISDDGRPYYAMKLIRGETLADAIDRFHQNSSPLDAVTCRMELHRLLRRMIDVCNAIDYAHGRGILHRDLKPSNVMLGKHGETLVVDWGLAKPIGASDRVNEEHDLEEGPLWLTSDAGETLPGSTVGTPSYMSPEQATGPKQAIGPRSDVYSLGATLYYLLTGRAPIATNDLKPIDQDDHGGKIPRPRQLNPRIPPPLEAICLKAMALLPEDRYESPRILADEIERWQADEPVLAFRDPLTERVFRWARRQRTIISAAVAALVVAIVAFGLILVVQARANRELRRSNEMAKRLNQELTFSQSRLATTVEELKASSLRERARFDLALDAIRSFHNGLSDDLLLRESEFAGIRSRLLSGAIAFYRKLEGQLEGQSDRSSREATARIFSQIAELEATLGTHREILVSHRRALELRRGLAKECPNDPTARVEVASSLISLGIMVRTIEGAEPSLHLLEEARSILEEAARIAPNDQKIQNLLVQSLREIGEGRLAKQQQSEALDLIERATRLQLDLVRSEPSSFSTKHALATLMNRKAIIQLSMGRYVEAFETFSKALTTLEELVRIDPRNGRLQLLLSDVLKDMGDEMIRRGKLVESLQFHRQALQIRESLSAALPMSTGYRVAISHSLLAIGRIHLQTGRKTEAIAEFRRSIALQEGVQPSANGLFNLACTRAYLTRCLNPPESQDETARAVATFQKALDAGFRNSSSIRRMAESCSAIKASPEYHRLLRDLDFPVDPFVPKSGPRTTRRFELR